MDNPLIGAREQCLQIIEVHNLDVTVHGLQAEYVNLFRVNIMKGPDLVTSVLPEQVPLALEMFEKGWLMREGVLE